MGWGWVGTLARTQQVDVELTALLAVLVVLLVEEEGRCPAAKVGTAAGQGAVHWVAPMVVAPGADLGAVMSCPRVGREGEGVGVGQGMPWVAGAFPPVW